MEDGHGVILQKTLLTTLKGRRMDLSSKGGRAHVTNAHVVGIEVPKDYPVRSFCRYDDGPEPWRAESMAANGRGGVILLEAV